MAVHHRNYFFPIITSVLLLHPPPFDLFDDDDSMLYIETNENTIITNFGERVCVRIIIIPLCNQGAAAFKRFKNGQH